MGSVPDAHGDKDFALTFTYTTSAQTSSNHYAPTLLSLNRTKLDEFGGGPTFPFPRMATTTPPESHAFFLYHQINSTYIGEEIWDSGIYTWTSNTISLEDI